MIQGGHVVIYVSNMDQAVSFYTDALGLKLQNRYGDHYAEVDAGGGLILGLHPAGPQSPEPGTPGSLGLTLGVSETIEREVKALESRGVKFKTPITQDGPVKLAPFADPDGNPLCLCQSS